MIHVKIQRILTILLALSLAIVSIAGLFSLILMPAAAAIHNYRHE